MPLVPPGDDRPARRGRFADAVDDMMRQMDEGLRARLDEEAALGAGEVHRRLVADQGRTRSFRTHAPGANHAARAGQFDWSEFDNPPPPPASADDDLDLDVATHHHGDVIDTTAHDPDPPPAGALTP